MAVTRRTRGGWTRRLPAPVRGVWERIRQNDLLLASAALAFYALVSLAPFTIVVMWLVGLFLGDQRLEQAATAVGEVAPEELGVERALRRVAEVGSGLGVTAVVLAIWPATAYGAGLARAFERLAGKRRRVPALRGRALLVVVLLPLVVMGSLIGVYAAGRAVTGGERLLWLLLVVALGTAAAFAALVVVFSVFPPDRLRRQDVLLASGWSLAGMTMLSLLFALFLRAGANFREHYATSGLAAVVLLALWLFLSNTVVLLAYLASVERADGRG